MQSDLVIKENELIDPSDYPEDQRSLVDDFNLRIRRLTGIITGIGKEYHTIWVSAGAAFFRKGDKRSFDELYKLADNGVYESKKASGSAINFSV